MYVFILLIYYYIYFYLIISMSIFKHYLVFNFCLYYHPLSCQVSSIAVETDLRVMLVLANYETPNLQPIDLGALGFFFLFVTVLLYG